MSAKKVSTLPYAYGGSDGRRAISLEKDGIFCVPALEVNRFSKSLPAVDEHRHPGCIEFIYCVRGRPVFDCAGRNRELSPGHVLAIKPETTHRLLTNRQGMLTYGLIFRLNTAQPMLRLPEKESKRLADGLRNLPDAPFAAADNLSHIFRRLFDVYDRETKGTYKTLLLRILVLQMMVTLLESANFKPERPGGNDRIDRLIEDIRRHPEKPRTNDEMAGDASVSLSLLASQFKEKTGFPPHAFVMECRLAEALRLLRETDDSITAVSLRLGFASVPHLAARFRHKFGITPRQARQGTPTVC